MAKINPDALVTVNDVTDIILTDLTDEQVQAFINTAHRIIEDVLTGEGLSEETLKEVEQYLAAHLLTLRDPRVSTEKIGQEYSATYQGQSGLGLEATQYGQVAITLDPTGKLAAASKPLKQAKFGVHGLNAWE